MTTQTTRQLVLNLTVGSVWAQLLDLADSQPYTAASPGRGDLKWLSALNLHSVEATVEFAISTDNSIADQERLMPPLPLAQFESRIDNRGFTIPSTFGVWARMVPTSGSDGNMTVQGNVLEIVPD